MAAPHGVEKVDSNVEDYQKARPPATDSKSINLADAALRLLPSESA